MCVLTKACVAVVVYMSRGNCCLFVFIWREIVQRAAPRVAMTGQ